MSLRYINYTRSFGGESFFKIMKRFLTNLFWRIVFFKRLKGFERIDQLAKQLNVEQS